MPASLRPAYLALLCILEDRRRVRLIERYPNVTDRVHEWMLGGRFGGTHQAGKEGGYVTVLVSEVRS
jgi:hypothetical protein